MADRVVMRFSPRGMELYDRALAHAKECATCGPLAKSPKEAHFLIHKFGCLTGVLITQEWMEEYARLHTLEERKALAKLGESFGVPDRDWGSARG